MSNRLKMATVVVLLAVLGVTVWQALQGPPFTWIDTSSAEMAWWRSSMKTRDERLNWWREARFGMFIHWGVYSTLGGTWQGQTVAGYSEHIQRRLKIPIPIYREQVAGKFNPVNFNADEWVRRARDAGIGYIVITSKHHDGFAMFDSKVNDYNVVKSSAWHHDPMKDLKAACEKYSLKLGFYYSQAFDWGEENGAGNDWDYANPGGDKRLHGGIKWWETSPQLVDKTREYVDGKSIPQLRELIAQYRPALIWFDTQAKLPPTENLRILKAVREADPNVVVNSRVVEGLGDYLSTTDCPAEFPPYAGDWEGIPTTNNSYGYHALDRTHKSPAHFIQLLAKAAARGGNLLLNFGPRGDGTFDPADVAILQGIAQWMKLNAESIHGTTRTSLSVQAWGESTRKGKTLYLHVFDWPKDGKLIVGGLKSAVSGAFLLSDAGKPPLKTERLNDLDLRITVPTQAPNTIDAVIALECDGDISCDASRLILNSSDNTLRVFDGQLRGRSIQFAAGRQENAYVVRWSSPGDSISWPVRIIEPGTFKVSAIYDARSSGGTFIVKVGEHALRGAVKKGANQSEVLGTIQLQPGSFTIDVIPEKIVGGDLMNLRALQISHVR